MAAAKNKPESKPKAAPPRDNKRDKKLLHFYDHDDQDARDLAYGAQKELCKKYHKTETAYVDGSITGDWTPDQD